MTPLELQAGVASFAFILLLYLKRRNASNLPLPPGPRKLPLIGNLLDIPKRAPWRAFHKWSQELGSEIIHLDVAGVSIIVLDNEEVISELLDKRSSIYSSRPKMTMVTDPKLMGWDFSLFALPYGDAWRQQRRITHQEFNQHAAIQFHPHQIKATHTLLRHILNEPDNLLGHLRQLAGETIMSIAYGIQVKDKSDPYVTTAEHALESLVTASAPGAFLVDIFPILKHVPDWMPFAGFKRQAKEWRKLASTMLNMPYDTTMRNIRNGEFTPSFVSACLEKINESSDVECERHVIKNTAGSLYTAASDTTVSVIAFCVRGLLSNPEALRKARQEIDSVVSSGHFPTFDDKDQLPYITAITKEAFRWRDVTPIGVPRFIEVEDVYKGYRIPAGSIVIPNFWHVRAILHDENIYPDPFKFNPDRFMKNGKLNPDVKNPESAAFGSGRRICPGRYMGFSSVWLAVACLIATFDISKAVDENGDIIEPTNDYISGGIRTAVPYKCSIKPRSTEAEAMIRATIDVEYF